MILRDYTNETLRKKVVNNISLFSIE